LYSSSSPAKPNRAITDYDDCIKFAPGFLAAPWLADAYYNRGQAWRAKGALRQALADAQKAAELDPKQERYQKLVHDLAAEQQKTSQSPRAKP
jgi:tetratricopeptide (TPR) repeat protein